MGKEETNLVSLWIFILILNLIFPVLGYTFTAFGEQVANFDLSIDADALMAIGINLVDGESHNVTWKGGFVYYSLLNNSIRCEWEHLYQVGVIYYDGLRFTKQSAIGLAFDNWWFPVITSIKSIGSNDWFLTLRNETIERDWDPEHNWSRFVLQDGQHVFITPFDNDGNITKAIYETGNLNVTVAKSFDEEDTTINFWKFVGWYTSILVGDQSWGLPSMFSWVIRILAALSIFAGIMLARRMIPL